MTDIKVFERNAEKAAKLEAEHNLLPTYRDLYAWEELTAEEAIGLQEYRDRTYPKYTGIETADLALREAFEKEYATWDLDETKLVDPKAKDLYESFCLEIDEALELQRIRSLRS
jgi:hypothetical protein